MKAIFFLLIIIFASVFYSSCCKGPYPIAGITLSYPGLSNPEVLKAVRTSSENITVIIDTLMIGELNLQNNYSILLEFQNNSPDYIIYVENTHYIDTISEIVIERASCTEKIKKFQYRFNGIISSNRKLTIH